MHSFSKNKGLPGQVDIMDPEDIGALGSAESGDYGSRAIAFINWQAQKFFKKGFAGMTDEYRSAQLFTKWSRTKITDWITGRMYSKTPLFSP